MAPRVSSAEQGADHPDHEDQLRAFAVQGTRWGAVAGIAEYVSNSYFAWHK